MISTEPRPGLPEDAFSSTVRFRRDQRSSGISRTGRLMPGGRMRIEYDPARLIPEQELATTTAEIIAHALFSPGGELRGGALQADTRVPATAVVRPMSLVIDIPEHTAAVELWFEQRRPEGPVRWDSRYGQNFRFLIAEEGLPVPEQSVVLRSNASVDPGRIHVLEDAASKDQSNLGASGTALLTELSFRARIAATEEVAAVWADIHVLDATGELIHAGTVFLHEAGPNPVNGPMLAWSAQIYQGSGGGSGLGVWSRPDAHFVQYRLYCELGEQVLTDGVLHEFEVPPDAEIRPTPGAW